MSAGAMALKAVQGQPTMIRGIPVKLQKGLIGMKTDLYAGRFWLP